MSIMGCGERRRTGTAGLQRNSAGELSVPFSLIYADVRGLADREGISEEEAGRILRYESFESEGKKWESEEPGAGTSSVKTAVALTAGIRQKPFYITCFAAAAWEG